MNQHSGAHIHISGIVQGVGFRPFVYSLAIRLSLTGWVRNTSAGVDIEVDGTPGAIDEFTTALREQAPPLARIDAFEVNPRTPDGYTSFEIIHSEAIPQAFQPISPDVSICEDCLRELFDPNDRRYRYPFINCTNCGPRFTIIEDIPYDRPKTTMASFTLCPDCAAEYANPLDRRFHAQPVACPLCGPQVWLEVNPSVDEAADDSDGISPNPYYSGPDAINETQRLIRSGKIVAIKGLGGFHLACDATNLQAVKKLRRRKLRVDKPFALMMPDIATIASHCVVESVEAELLETYNRPIVILPRRPESNIAPQVAPQQDTIGAMLPYTPLHYLLFANGDNLSPLVLVMTSGNLSEEPIATGNNEARQRLSSLADAFLMHDRPIHTRCDDSVVRVFQANDDQKSPEIVRNYSPIILRRSRGYAPNPVQIPWEAAPLLATGAELKNTFCLTRDKYAFLSHHIGDMENFETLQSFEDGINHFERLFKIEPESLAYDLHPNYLATRYALERADREGLPAVGVQHHHAHIAACMAENGLTGDQPVIGVSFDGTGYGDDGAIWGGEFLLADYKNYQRFAHLAYAHLPGGDAAVRKPARIALAYLWDAHLDWEPSLPPVSFLSTEERTALSSLLKHNINSPLTSSMGRLFDAVAALIGVRQQINYEAQAAIELEALADSFETFAYPFEFITPKDKSSFSPLPINIDPLIIDPTPLIRSILSDLREGVPVGRISARFHNGVAEMVSRVCEAMRNQRGINQVALSGGVWQNLVLFHRTTRLLNDEGFEVFFHSEIPPNDGGLALGQAAIASHHMQINSRS